MYSRARFRWNFPMQLQMYFSVFTDDLFVFNIWFFRAVAIGWTVSHRKYFVHMTPHGARDWPAVIFPTPTSYTVCSTAIN